MIICNTYPYVPKSPSEQHILLAICAEYDYFSESEWERETDRQTEREGEREREYNTDIDIYVVVASVVSVAEVR